MVISCCMVTYVSCLLSSEYARLLWCGLFLMLLDGLYLVLPWVFDDGFALFVV